VAARKCQAMPPAAAPHLTRSVCEQRMDVVHRIHLGGCYVVPAETQRGKAALLLGDHPARFFGQPGRRNIAAAHDMVAVIRFPLGASPLPAITKLLRASGACTV